MTLKVTIQPTVPSGNYPVFYTMDGGVSVGPVGELRLVAQVDVHDRGAEFRIYAPGTWREVNVEYIND